METDYLVIGGGAVGMAFADTLLDESDAHITIVDRRSMPGGHWNDAYPFVTLHQPSAYYGVNSTELGSRRIDTSGPNQGLYEMASGPEVIAYYDKLMQHRFLPSGRVTWLPSSEYRGDGRIMSLLSGSESTINVRRKTVDATAFSPAIPATHTPQFSVAEGQRVVPPNALPQLWLQRQGTEIPKRFCILGAGKTGMDVGVWLLRNGVPAQAIQWVMPRDSWIFNRLNAQPGVEFFEHSIGAEATKLGAFARSETIDEVFLHLEKAGSMLRIDRDHLPTMFHYATISTGEVGLLRTIRNVIRKGRVRSIEREGLVLDEGRIEMEPATLFVDCTASAIRQNVNEPVFQGDRICVRLLRAPLVTLSAAVTAYLEVHGEDDAHKNRMASPVPFPHNLAGYAVANIVSMKNQFAWSQDREMQQWLRRSRLEGFAKMVSEIGKEDAQKQALLGQLRANAMAAMEKLPKLAAGAR